MLNFQAKIANTEKYCSQHEGEIKRFYCETCGVAICPDCCALDPTHHGHRFIRLEDAKNKQSIGLRTFIDNFDDLRDRYNVAIRQTESIKGGLQHSIQTVYEDLDQLKDQYTNMIEAAFEKHRVEVANVWEQRSEELNNTSRGLETSLASLQVAYERGRDIIDTGSDYDILSAYSFMTIASVEADEPSAADPIIGQVVFEADNPEISSVGRLTCGQRDSEDLIDLESEVEILSPSPSPAPFGIADVENARSEVTSGFFEFAEDKSLGAYNMAYQPEPGEKRQSSFKEITGLRRWKPSGQFRTTPGAERPKAIAVHANGDIALTSRKSPMTVFSKGGDVKCIQKGSYCNASDIAISAENHYIVTGNNEIKVYSSKWFGTRRLFSFPTFNFQNRPGRPTTVHVDSCGKIIVGMHDGKTISIHQPDGSALSMFETPHPPRRLAVTSNDELAVILDNNTVQIINQQGYMTKTVEPPPGVEWIPWYICCSKQGQLIISNQGNPKAVFMYIYRDGQYRVTDCLLKLENNGIPYGVTLSHDERELFVVDRSNNVVKKFQAQYCPTK